MIKAPGLADFYARVITGIVLAAGMMLAVWLGGQLFAGVIAAAAVLILREWRGLTQLRSGIYLAALAILACALALILIDPRLEGLGMAAGLLAAGGVGLALIGGPAALGLAYAGVPAVALIWLRGLPWGFALLVWLLGVVVATDVFAYLCGRMVGGRKLAPRISPGKTWSGLVGGIVAALLAGWLLARYFGLPHWVGLSGGVMAVLAQSGDLFESWLKRRAGVKDSGRLLPGHGGLMDRVDGLLPVAVATALAIVIGMEL